MSTRLVILGLLRERPMHGYEIKHMIEDHMGDWTSIAFGSIYFALKKLTEEGLLDVKATEKAGNRPSRTIYHTTRAGREEFAKLLRELWATPERQFFAIDLGLFFVDALPAGELEEFLEERIRHLEEGQRHLIKHRQENLDDPQVPKQARWVFDHSLAHLNAELMWLQRVQQDIRGGKDRSTEA
jgi:DNA-binding PadR family transcriptional regulator